MPTHSYELKIRGVRDDGPEVRQLAEWLGGVTPVIAISRLDQEGVCHVTVDVPTGLVQETETIIARWDALYPGLLDRDADEPTY
jgi:hypothetical protein